MNLPPELEFHEASRLLIYRPVGLVNKAALDKVVATLDELEIGQSAPFNRFTDTLSADEIELSYQSIIQFSIYRRFAYMGHPPVRSAILVKDATLSHYARMHALLTRGSPIKVGIFHRYAEAAPWLGVPRDMLIRKKAS